MCYFRRLVYDHCSHVKFLGPDPVRKCHLQLAYECGETEVPCGKMIEHSYMSIKVDENCKSCAAKINKAQGTLSRIRDQLAMAKLKLRLPAETLGNLEADEDEALSPVDLTLGFPDLLGLEGGRGLAKRGQTRVRGDELRVAQKTLGGRVISTLLGRSIARLKDRTEG